MMKPIKILLLSLFVFANLSFEDSLIENTNSFSSQLKQYNNTVVSAQMPNDSVFQLAKIGYEKLKNQGLLGNKNLLTIVDFSLSSKNERLWIFNMEKGTLVHSSLVAHGKNSGEEYAHQFSNTIQSYKSSLGFYITGNTYHGRHGLSLYLEGIEKKFNANARKRAIVMHSANYVSYDFIEKYGRLGRSFGCPSIPIQNHKDIINLLSNKTCLFIYYPDDKYMKESKILNEDA